MNIFLIIIATLLIATLLIFMDRNNFVHKTQIAWICKIYYVQCYDIEYNRKEPFSSEELSEAIYGDNKMLKYFWIRNLDKMVENRKAYNYVNETYEKINLDDLKKKLAKIMT